MRAFQTSVRLISAMFLAVTALTATGVEAQNPATFTSDIRPIMERSCWACHGEELQRSGLDLRTRADAIWGRGNGAALAPADEEHHRKKKNFDVFRRVREAALLINGLSAEAAKQLGKDSSGTDAAEPLPDSPGDPESPKDSSSEPGVAES